MGIMKKKTDDRKEDPYLQGAIEAIVFASGEPVSIERISQVLEVEPELLNPQIGLLMDRYNRKGRGIRLVELDGYLQMCTDSQYSQVVRKTLEMRRNTPLSQAAMEVLAVIAYNQPVSRSFIEQVRGVDSSSTVTKLLEKGLIEEAGRLDLPGRPVAFQTTDTFLRVFGLGGLKDLPPLHDEVAEDAAAGDVQEAPMADGEEQAEQLEWK